MLKIIVPVLLLVGIVGGGLWFMGQGEPIAQDENSAQQLAAAFANNVYGQPPQVPSQTSPETSQQPAPPTLQTEGTSVTMPNTTNEKKVMNATLHTNQGDITIEFLDVDAPNTVANFTKLAKSGFYDGTKFHRVIAGFMIQGGDPLSKDDSMMSRWGTGGPGYQFADEIHANNKNAIGTIAMANAGPNTNGSQFFINVANNNFLDTKHTVFGKIIAGMDVVKKIETTPTGSGDKPTSPMIIESIALQ